VKEADFGVRGGVAAALVSESGGASPECKGGVEGADVVLLHVALFAFMTWWATGSNGCVQCRP
jgi:hypothetical protein